MSIWKCWRNTAKTISRRVDLNIRKESAAADSFLIYYISHLILLGRYNLAQVLNALPNPSRKREGKRLASARREVRALREWCFAFGEVMLGFAE